MSRKDRIFKCIICKEMKTKASRDNINICEECDEELTKDD